MSLADEIVSGLEEFVEALRSGERIMVSTVERCVCNANGEKKGSKQCHLCAGRGWILGAKTLFDKSVSA